MDYPEQIDEIMDYFDFRRVHETMKALNWTWADTAPDVPEEYQLRQVARQLLRRVSERKFPGLVATGGFVAKREAGRLSLEFVVSEWTAGE